MTGLAGMFRLDERPADPVELDRMAGAIAHRARDGIDGWEAGPLGLRHLWFRSTPESLEETAPAVVDERWVVAGDVRIDDREALFERLGCRGAGAPPGDLALVGMAVARWGDHAFARLRGDFALAVWDAHRRELRLARDPLGVRPLVWWSSPSAFAFASQPAAIRAIAPTATDEDSVLRYLLGREQPLDSTFFRGIRRVPPATVLTCDLRGRVTSRRYWRLEEVDALVRELAADPLDDLVKRFRDLLEREVRARLRTSAPVGLEVSGGLDSSGVAGFVRRAVGPEASLHGYSILFGAEADSGLIDAVARESGIGLTQIPEAFVHDRGGLRRSVGDDDSPLFIDGPVAIGPTYAAAAAGGTRVLLGGLDGDAVVAHGPLHLRDLATRLRLGELAREAGAYARRTGRSPADVILGQVVAPSVPTWALEARDRLRRLRQGSSTLVRPGLVRPALARRFPEETSPRLRAGSALWAGSALRAAQVEHLQHEDVPAFLEQVDSAAARAGVEPRHPFFGRDLVSFCVSLPGEARLHDGWTRWIERKAVADVVPPQVAWLPSKIALGETFYEGIVRRQWGELTRLVREDGGRAAGWIDRGALRATYRASSRGDVGAGVELYSLWRLDRWLEATGA
ncbi:MAG: asparagine synthase-related protein [Actinomycetota bacterium]